MDAMRMRLSTPRSCVQHNSRWSKEARDLLRGVVGSAALRASEVVECCLSFSDVGQEPGSQDHHHQPLVQGCLASRFGL